MKLKPEDTTPSYRPVRKTTSLLKSIVWRVLGVVVLASVTFYFTRHLMITTKITITHHAVFLLIFYLHERCWALFPRPVGKARSIMKSLIYEIGLGMGGGGLIVYMFTGSFPMVTSVTGSYTLIKLVLYPIYDRLWPELRLASGESSNEAHEFAERPSTSQGAFACSRAPSE
jgi:uncharacterized membrane protein